MKWTKYVKGSDSPIPNPVELRRIRISGTTTHVQGQLGCPICGTGCPVAGRPGQRVAVFKFTCRCCNTPITVTDLTFGCSN